MIWIARWVSHLVIFLVLCYTKEKKFVRRLEILQNKVMEAKSATQTFELLLANGVYRAFDHIGDFVLTHKEFNICVMENENQEAVEKLLTQKGDCVLVIGRDDRLQQEIVAQLPIGLWIYQGHPYYECKEISICMLKDQNLLSMNEHSRIYIDLVSACKSEHFIPNIRMFATDGEALEGFCAAGVGLAISPYFFQEARKNLRFVPFSGGYTWDIYMSWIKEKSQNQGVKLMREWLKKERNSNEKI